MKRTTLFATAALGIIALAACSNPAPDTPSASAPAAPTAAPTAPAVTTSTTATAAASGTFAGRSDHITTGDASIIGTPGAYELVLAADFSLDGAPDPIVGFGTDGTYNPATKLGALKQQTGAQRYSLPADFNPANVSEVYVWCEKFDVPLGVASFASAPVSEGTFSGLSDHITTGGASIIGTDGAYKLVLATDFSLDGAPDPIVGFGSNGTYSPATKLGALQNKTGSQTYDLPASFNPADVSEVYIWCEKFDVPLGVAKF